MLFKSHGLAILFVLFSITIASVEATGDESFNAHGNSGLNEIPCFIHEINK